jgi:hypothetical protein
MSTNSASTVAPDAGATTQGHGLLRAAALTGAAALVVNLIIWAIASAISDVPDRFTPLQPGSIVFMTVLGVAAAAGVYAFLRSRVSDPAATFRRIVPVALAVSLVPDVLIWASDGYEGAAKAETVLPLMAMHVATALIVAALLPRREEASR